MDYKPVSEDRGSLETVAVYVFEDRLEVGRTNPLGLESLRRVVFRDATRMVVWNDARRITRGIGIFLLVVAVLSAAVAFAVSDQVTGVVVGGVAGALLLGGLACLWKGRPNALTRFRLEGLRGQVEGVLVGRPAKRERIVNDVMSRIQARQADAASDDPGRVDASRDEA